MAHRTGTWSQSKSCFTCRLLCLLQGGSSMVAPALGWACSLLPLCGAADSLQFSKVFFGLPT